MSKSLEVKIQACLEQASETILNQKLKSYNLGKEFNYAVASLKLLITNSETETKGTLTINLIPKVQYVAPFVNKKLAEEYCKELLSVDKISLLLPVEEGKIIVKNEDVSLAFDKLNTQQSRNVTEISSEIPTMGYINLLALNWNCKTEQEKDEIAFQIGGIKNCQDIKSMFDNWKFE